MFKNTRKKVYSNDPFDIDESTNKEKNFDYEIQNNMTLPYLTFNQLKHIKNEVK